MIVEILMIHHPFLENDLNDPLPVVDQRKWRNRARFDAERLIKQVRLAKAQVLCPDQWAKGFQINGRFLQADDQVEVTAFVLQEQILAMPARQMAGMLLRFLDGENRDVMMGFMTDSEFIQSRQQIFRGCRQFSLLPLLSYCEESSRSRPGLK